MSRALRETTLWVGATLGALCLLWTVVVFAFGLTPLVFTSGSMAPAIGAGDLAFATTVDAGDLAVGDVVSVINDRGTRITHRITKVDDQDDGDAVLHLQGDANREPDEQAYRVTEAERVVFSVPLAGHVVNAVGSPNGMFVGGFLVAGLLYLGFRRNGGDDDDGPSVTGPHDRDGSSGSGEDDAGGRLRRVATTGACAVVVGLAITSSGAHSSMAAFSDTAALATGTVGASALPVRPSSIACQAPAFSATATVTWADDDPRYGYYYEVDDDAAFGSPDRQVTVGPSGSNSFVFSASSTGGFFSSTTYHIRIYSAFVDAAGTVTWRSASYRSYRVSRALFVNTYSCGAVTSPAG